MTGISGELPGESSSLATKGVTLRYNINAKSLTTMAVGGPVSGLIEPNSEEELITAVKVLRDADLPYRVLGAGSNTVVSDQGVRDWVIRLGRGFRYTRSSGPGEIVVGGGMSLMNLARQCSQEGLSGLEFAAGIPATLGGAVRMNAGAHGSQISAVLKELRAICNQGKAHVVPLRELTFSYRNSGLPMDWIITEAVLSLVPSGRDEVMNRMQEALIYRKSTQPLHLPSAGSVFKNPDSSSAGSLIEQCGLKGKKIGGAEISMMHGNWIVNEDKDASSTDVLNLINFCREQVQARFNIELEPEIVIWS